MASTPTILRVNEPFACNDAEGQPRVFRAGDLVASNDPVVKGREQFFTEAVAYAAAHASAIKHTAAVVEAATAAPGEKRSIGTQVKTED